MSEGIKSGIFEGFSCFLKNLGDSSEVEGRKDPNATEKTVNVFLHRSYEMIVYSACTCIITQDK